MLGCHHLSLRGSNWDAQNRQFLLRDLSQAAEDQHGYDAFHDGQWHLSWCVERQEGPGSVCETRSFHTAYATHGPTMAMEKTFAPRVVRPPCASNIAWNSRTMVPMKAIIGGFEKHRPQASARGVRGGTGH